MMDERRNEREREREKGKGSESRRESQTSVMEDDGKSSVSWWAMDCRQRIGRI